jgi:hypothetical protein
VADTASAAAGTAGDALSGASAKAAGWASESKDDLSSLFDQATEAASGTVEAPPMQPAMQR